jgi:hypothetical protein
MARRRRFVAVTATARTSQLGPGWGLAPALAATNPRAGYASGYGLQPGRGKTSPEEDVTVKESSQ